VGSRQEVAPPDYEAAIGERTAAVVYFLGRQPEDELGEVIDIAHAAGVPVIVDAADQVPPRSNLTNLTARGADLVVFSGGKGLSGPQSSGLILGRRNLVEACRLNSSPNSAIGRGMKVGKEEIAGLLTGTKSSPNGSDTAGASEPQRTAWRASGPSIILRSRTGSHPLPLLSISSSAKGLPSRREPLQRPLKRVHPPS
jgi:L-seryl-tRNA(Ser) seleniumtransferase